MEFSFDRSKNTNSNSGQQSTNQAASNSDEVDTSQIANERLRKAIERNRARQREREQQSAQSGRQAPTSSAASSAWAQHQAAAGVSNPREEMEHHQESLFEKQRQDEARAQHEARLQEEYARRQAEAEALRAQQTQQAQQAQQAEHQAEPSQTTFRRPPRRPFASRATEMPSEAPSSVEANSNADEAFATPSRRTVARPHDTEFAPVRRTSKRAAAQISYTTGTKKKGKELDQKYVDWLVKGSWLFCGFLVLRLIFASGGIMAYFQQKSILNDRFSDLSKIKKENMSLVREIERMQLDASYQKKLVRDNLGFIAQDEYLILFPKD